MHLLVLSLCLLKTFQPSFALKRNNWSKIYIHRSVNYMHFCKEFINTYYMPPFLPWPLTILLSVRLSLLFLVVFGIIYPNACLKHKFNILFVVLALKLKKKGIYDSSCFNWLFYINLKFQNNVHYFKNYIKIKLFYYVTFFKFKYS